MTVQNPIFIIPKENARREKVLGGGGKPLYRGDKAKFEEHKRRRVDDIDNLIKTEKSNEATISNPNGEIIYEIEFHREAIAKSAQPVKILESSNIDISAQLSETTFLASSTEDNLISFRNYISKLDVVKNENDSSYLSAITKIKPLVPEDKLLGKMPEGSDVKAFLYLVNSVSIEDAKSITAEINKLNNESEFFLAPSGAKIITGIFSKSLIESLLTASPSNPIYKIEPYRNFTLLQNIEIEYPHEEIKLNMPELDAYVAIIDSGVQITGLLQDLVVDTISIVKDPSNLDLNHGTFVSSRAIFGNTIEKQIFESKMLTAEAKVLNVIVFQKNSKGDVEADPKDIIKTIKDIVSDPKYSQFKVFNLSLNIPDHTLIPSGKKTFLTRELDSIAYENDVIFIVTSGNYTKFANKSYPDLLYESESAITPPADIVNGFSVGSIADTESSRSIALNNEPSPFTRTGLIGYRKPDLVNYGGNCTNLNSSAGIGVKGFSVNEGKIIEDVGTSYAAPLVSQTTAKIYSYLKETNEFKDHLTDLSKALTIHSSSYNLPQNSNISKDDLDRLVGFGIPDFTRAISCTNSIATFIYCDSLGELIKDNTGKFQKIKKHKIKFPLPKELEGSNRMISVKGTLVYTPMISAAGEVDYTLANIDMNLHYKNSRGTSTAGNLTEGSCDYRLNWNPIKCFEKSYRAYMGDDWEIWLMLNLRGQANVESYVQKYALVITIEDISPELADRVNLYQIIREKFPQYIALQNRLELEVRN